MSSEPRLRKNSMEKNRAKNSVEKNRENRKQNFVISGKKVDENHLRAEKTLFATTLPISGIAYGKKPDTQTQGCIPQMCHYHIVANSTVHRTLHRNAVDNISVSDHFKMTAILVTT